MSYRPLICKIRCHNPNRKGAKAANRNYLTYIATREGVDLSPTDDINKLLEHQKILQSDINDEYVFKEADDIKYLQYINYRPRSHGLFGNIDTSDLKALSNQVSELTRSGRNIYRGIVSLSQMDAEAMGFTEKKQWENYLKQVMPDVAKELGVSPTNFTWVAAFHAEKTHPHIHFELWDNRDKVKSPFIHVSVQHQCRNILSKSIFSEEYENMIKEVLRAERDEINKIRNVHRKEILDNVKEFINIFDDIPESTLPDRISIADVEEILQHLDKLLDILPVSGSIDYAYLPKPVKKQVDEINALLMKRADINRAMAEYIKAIEEGNKLDGKNKFEIRKNIDNSIADINKRMGNIILRKAKELKMTEVNLLDVYSNIKENIISNDNNISDELPGQAINISEVEKIDSNISKEVIYNNIEDDFENFYGDNINSDQVSKDLPDETLKSFLSIKSIEEFSLFEDTSGNTKQNELLMTSESRKPDLSDEGYHISWNEKYRKALDYIYGENKDYNKAIKLLASEAAGKNVLAISDLGKIYEKGLGFEINKDKAEIFYKKAYQGFLSIERKKPHKYIEYRIGKLFNSGIGVEKNYEEAAFWYKLSVNENYKYAQYSLGVLYRNGLGIPEGTEDIYSSESLSLFEKSAAQDNAYAAYEAAMMYEKGIGTEVDKSRAEKYYKAAFNGFNKMLNEREDDQVLYRVGYMLCHGIGTDKDENKGISYLEKSAELNNVNALYLLSKLYLEKGDAEKIYKAISILEKLANADNDMAQYSLGKIYIDGTYVDKDTNKGLELLHRAADLNEQKTNEKGNQFAQYQLGKMYYEGKEITRDIIKALEYINQSIEQDNDMAMYLKGKIYADEETEVYDIDTAISYYEKSAEKGNQYAQYQLGIMHLWGRKVPKDEEKGIYWLKKSSEQGNEYAKEALDMYYRYTSRMLTGTAFSIVKHVFSGIMQHNHDVRSDTHSFRTKSKQAKKELYLKNQIRSSYLE